MAETMQVPFAASRVEILARLREGDHSVGGLAAAVGMERSAISHQLAVLRHLELVVGERRGRQVTYALHDVHLGELLEQAAFHVEHVRLGRPDPIVKRRAP